MLKRLAILSSVLILTGCAVYAHGPSPYMGRAYYPAPVISHPNTYKLQHCNIYVQRYNNCTRLMYSHQVLACQHNEISHYNNCLYR
jgi:hypothetical protein